MSSTTQQRQLRPIRRRKAMPLSDLGNKEIIVFRRRGAGCRKQPYAQPDAGGRSAAKPDFPATSSRMAFEYLRATRWLDNSGPDSRCQPGSADGGTRGGARAARMAGLMCFGG